jgi:hypothetical protein
MKTPTDETVSRVFSAAFWQSVSMIGRGSTHSGPPRFFKADAHRCRIAYQAVLEGIDKQFDYRA